MARSPIEANPINAGFGAVVTGVALADLSVADADAVLEFAHRYAVLVFPGQFLSDDEHLAFARVECCQNGAADSEQILPGGGQDPLARPGEPEPD